MPEIPRRLPPTPAERLSVVVSRMAGGSDAGATRWAQPVRSSTYRAADAVGPAETATGGSIILTSVLMERHVMPVEYEDEVPIGVFHDVLGLAGLQSDCLYLIEAEVVASFDYSTSSYGQTGVSLLWGGPERDNGTTGVSYTTESYNLTRRRDAYTEPDDIYTVSSYQSSNDYGILGTRVRMVWIIGVGTGEATPPPLRVRAALIGQSDHMINSGAFIRATYLGPVIHPS